MDPKTLLTKGNLQALNFDAMQKQKIDLAAGKLAFALTCSVLSRPALCAAVDELMHSQRMVCKLEAIYTVSEN